MLGFRGVFVTITLMSNTIELNPGSIDAFSQDWNDREVLQSISRQLDSFIETVNSVSRGRVRNLTNSRGTIEGP